MPVWFYLTIQNLKVPKIKQIIIGTCTKCVLINVKNWKKHPKKVFYVSQWQEYRTKKVNFKDILKEIYNNIVLGFSISNSSRIVRIGIMLMIMIIKRIN